MPANLSMPDDVLAETSPNRYVTPVPRGSIFSINIAVLHCVPSGTVFEPFKTLEKYRVEVRHVFKDFIFGGR